MTSILGYTELLVDGDFGELSPAQTDVIRRVDRNGRRLLRLVEDLLALTRIESNDVGLVRTPVDIARLTKIVWDSLQVAMNGRDLRAALHVPSDVAEIFADFMQLERALLNLVTNAVKFTPDGGAVTLTVRTVTAGVSFEVSDTGIGIAQEDQDAVFQPFFRTEDAHLNAVPGSGIGLAVVQRIVEAHDGHLALSSTLGRGTTVQFTLPA